MFSFLKRKKPIHVEASRLQVDLHSHLIPGIDDGSGSMEESLALLRRFVDLGYSKVITTPHIMFDGYRNTPAIIREGRDALIAAAAEADIPITIEAAAEYYLDEGFPGHLAGGDILTIADRYVLFETSYVARPMQLEAWIYEISAAGYTPLMAHPERYRYITDPARQYAAFRDLGVAMQINLNSFGGHYGKTAQKNAAFLSRAGMIDFLGSDTHGMRHLDALDAVLSSPAYARIFENNTICNDELL